MPMLNPIVLSVVVPAMARAMALVPVPPMDQMTRWCPVVAPACAEPVIAVAQVDTARSVVRWRGTKFGGRGAHAGTVRLRGGTLDYDPRRASVRGGVIELDMRSIAVTDIPDADADTRARLLRHLLATDFFDVARHPIARFTITSADVHSGNLLRLDGTLLLRGVTRPLTLEATVWSFEPTRLAATGRTTIDRQRWGIAFRGSRLTNDLVDDGIQLEFDLVAAVRAGSEP